MRKLRVWVLVGIVVGSPSYALASYDCTNPAACTVTCDGDADNTDFASAVDDVSDGGTITVGAGSCVFSGSVTKTVTKAFTIQGAGAGVTTISGDGNKFVITANANKQWRITGFTFTGSPFAHIYPKGTSNVWRIDHNTFTLPNSTRAINTMGPTYGVIDSNTFEDAAGAVAQNVLIIQGACSTDGGNAMWKDALVLGAEDTGVNKAVYIENNTFDFDTFSSGMAALDGNCGGKVVFRYNTVKNKAIGWHDATSGGGGAGERGMRWWELYNNKLEFTSNPDRCFNMRGGTGVAFNNTCCSASACTPSVGAYSITNYRSCNLSGVSDPWNTGRCDNTGELAQFSSGSAVSTCVSGAGCVNIDGNEDTTGYPCRDQMGTSLDDPTTYLPTKAPAYIWSNTLNGGASNPSVFNVTDDNPGCTATSEQHILVNRDFYTSAKSGYAPATCPHPLVGTGWCDTEVAGASGYHLGLRGNTGVTVGSGVSF